MRRQWGGRAVIGASLLLLTSTPGVAGEGPAPQPENPPAACGSSTRDNPVAAPPDDGSFKAGTPCLSRIESIPIVRTPTILIEPTHDPVATPRPIVRKGIAPELLAFLREIRVRIAEAREYPPNAITLGLQGTTIVKLTLQTDSHTHTVRIRKSSGHHMLDEAAIEAVQKVLPMKPPLEAGNRPLELDIPISFALR